jgi:hypothetical protein
MKRISKEAMDAKVAARKAAVAEIRAIRLEKEAAFATEPVQVLTGLLPADRFEILQCYNKMAQLAQRAIFVYQSFCSPEDREREVVDYLVDIHKAIIEATENLNGKKVKGLPFKRGART